MSHTVYFISDLHFGADSPYSKSIDREQEVAQWMEDAITGDTIYFLGDVFDYWYEYREVIPRGYSVFFAALRSAKDRGVTIIFHVGNHDMWMKDYFTKEFGIPTYFAPEYITIQGKNILMGHGDGLGPGDKKYKLMKSLFRNPLAKGLFGQLHPNVALSIMRGVSKTSRKQQKEEHFEPNNEMLIHYCEYKLKQQPEVDYFIFGHRHKVIDRLLSNQKSRYINLGDWIYYKSYAVLKDGKLTVSFNDKTHPIHT